MEDNVSRDHHTHINQLLASAVISSIADRHTFNWHKMDTVVRLTQNSVDKLIKWMGKQKCHKNLIHCHKQQYSKTYWRRITSSCWKEATSSRTEGSLGSTPGSCKYNTRKSMSNTSITSISIQHWHAREVSLELVQQKCHSPCRELKPCKAILQPTWSIKRSSFVGEYPEMGWAAIQTSLFLFGSLQMHEDIFQPP